MHHCVGGYDLDCATQPTQIFSVQTADGERLSTLQLKVRMAKNGGEFHFTIVEHLAAMNAEPQQEPLTAAAALVAALNKCRVPHQVAKAINAPSEMKAHDLCPFNFDDDAAWKTARACYMPLLPADLRALCPMELGRLAANFKLPQRLTPSSEQEQECDSDDFESRLLRWMR